MDYSGRYLLSQSVSPCSISEKSSGMILITGGESDCCVMELTVVYNRSVRS